MKTSKNKQRFYRFLLLNENVSFIGLEAKAEDRNPLIGKEQARTYARSQNCRFIIFQTATSTISGILSAAAPTSSQRFRPLRP